MKKYALDISLFVAGLPFDGNTITTGKSLGGSETAGLQLAEELARQGHHVSVHCNCENACEVGGVYYVPIGWVPSPNGGMFPKGFFDCLRSVPTDLLLVQRLPSMLQFELKSKVNLLWQHDLATRLGPSQFNHVLWNIDRILVLSQFQKKQYQGIHGGPDKLYHVTRNGIDPKLFSPEPLARDRFRLTYTARPERGLDILLQAVFPRILAREPRAKLYISRYQDSQTLPLYQQLEGVMKQFGDRIEFLGNLGKQELYKNYQQSRLYIYPSMFEEISCITSMEVSACGGVFLGPWRAALPETIGGAAPLYKDDGSLGQIGDEVETGIGKPPTERFMNAIADAAVRLMHDDNEWNYWQQRAAAQARAWTWDAVARDIIDLTHELIAQKVSDSKRLVRHFLFLSDVVSARRYADEKNDSVLKTSVENYIDRYMPFMSQRIPAEQRPTINDFYEQRSGGSAATWQTATFAETEMRLAVLKQFLQPKVESGEIKTLLDFGCAHGGYAKALTDAFPTLKVVGVDNSPSLIRCCFELKEQGGCKHPENMLFAVGDEEAKWFYADPWNGQPFDCVVGMEVLEHLPDAESAASKLERLCKPNGYCVFTVPYGHRERDEMVTKGVPPVHVRAFDLHDIRDLFEKKPDYSVVSFTDSQEHEMDRTFSCWFMVTYKADHQPLGAIDWDRKCFLQAPRQTLGVAVIAHNSEAVLHRCLRSIIKYADQMIVIDNGPSTDRTVEVAQEYTNDVRAGTSPFYCYKHMVVHMPEGIDPNECVMAGFETPRNESTEGLWTDWVLWLDTDEQLLDVNNMPKYLRDNAYLGYCIPQHHITLDPPTATKKDIPVRLYRNIPGMKFYGLVHEHAELGVNRGIGATVTILSDVDIHHDGYLKESIRRGRFKRNLRLLECDRRKYPDRLLGIFLYDIRDCMHMARYEMEQGGGVVTERVRQYAQTCVNAFRKHFMNTQFVMAEDAINYYTSALQLLGIGLDIAAELDIKPHNVPQPSHISLRFRAADTNEAVALLTARMNMLTSQLSGPYIQ